MIRPSLPICGFAFGKVTVMLPHEARRQLLLLGIAQVAMLPSAFAHRRLGAGRPLPEVRVVTDTGRATTLAGILSGRTTILHLVLTRCSASCPILGEVLSGFCGRLVSDRDPRINQLRIVSLSLDPLGDRPADLARWIARHRRGVDWMGAIPAAADMDRCAEFFRTGAGADAARTDNHLTSVFVFDSSARLRLETRELPGHGDLFRALREFNG